MVNEWLIMTGADVLIGGADARGTRLGFIMTVQYGLPKARHCRLVTSNADSIVMSKHGPDALEEQRAAGYAGSGHSRRLQEAATNQSSAGSGRCRAAFGDITRLRRRSERSRAGPRATWRHIARPSAARRFTAEDCAKEARSAKKARRGR